MPIKLNGATSGSVELDVPAAVGSDLQLTLPATAGEVVVKEATGSVDLGSINIDSSGNVGIGTTSPNQTSNGRTVLSLNGTTSALMNWNYTNTISGFIYGASDEFRMQAEGTIPLIFRAGGAETMRHHSDGEITKPKQPAFMAALNVNTDVITGIGAIKSRIVAGNGFTNVSINTGSCYDSSNTIFTAPVDGVYVFSNQISASSNMGANSYLGAEFYKNGSRISCGWRRSHSAGYQRVTANIILNLSANDTVEPGIETAATGTLLGGSTAAAQYTHFLGYLLH